MNDKIICGFSFVLIGTVLTVLSFIIPIMEMATSCICDASQRCMSYCLWRHDEAIYLGKEVLISGLSLFGVGVTIVLLSILLMSVWGNHTDMGRKP